MDRRRCLGVVATGIATELAGCYSTDDANGNASDHREGDASDRAASEDGTPTYPDECPVTQDLGLSVPDEIDASAVRSFVRQYEAKRLLNAIDEVKWTITYSLSPEVTAFDEVGSVSRRRPCGRPRPERTSRSSPHRETGFRTTSIRSAWTRCRTKPNSPSGSHAKRSPTTE
ncbi:hypothetical protein EA472_16650 [Natrarchaeobius oligotrophus]|uniref:Uncharacterized protein n=1 Tax=Natrarchaeobius chitinivorans TaxID=1679083 RepID=A0A3N6MDJ9_NATCH|nr:hypothetical protein EA472_16650 [Natrarchaeobius chitinivorans]